LTKGEAQAGDDIPFETARSVRTFENVVAQIRGLISEGHLRPGDKLPPERDLSVRLGCGRNAVREALRALEQAGIVTLRPGKGGGAFVTSGRPDVVVESMRDLLFLGSITFDDLWETRLALADVVVRLAVERMDEDDLAGLVENVAQANAFYDAGRLAEKSQANIDFHDRLAKATHNPMLAVIMASVSNLVTSFTQRLGSDPGPETLRSRVRFLAALRDRDVAAAQAEMRADLIRVHDFYQQLSSRRADEH
jgi:GntR family transcriptional regulator, transcriptional repressor for pyruvate dehydrogenase complex